MLNYPQQTGAWVDESQPNTEEFTPSVINPFPGLRPFTIEESHLFFGREGHVDEILEKLSRNRSVTIMGYSGSGKSSLVSCGLVPVLYGGFLTETGPNWHVLATRPGMSPISNLTDSIVEQLEKEKGLTAEDCKIQKAIIGSVLRSSSEGLVETIRFLQGDSRQNYFLLVDQFEELLRYRETDDESSNEAAQFVNLILTAVNQKEVPIYLSLSLRSDFVGECSQFPGLTQMINVSNYLVPQMSREQKRLVIEGPIAVGGGKITPRLVKRLLNDIGDNQDQLPILQHALMRTWDYWIANREEGEPIDVRHYNAIGRISQALSLHANEAFEELTSGQKEIAEILFKSTTEKNLDNQGLRRPARISLIAEQAAVTEEEVIKVVDNFRKAGRSFLMPGSHMALSGSTNIELSHESLMRIWTRLANWVDEEFESSQMYKRISDAATLYQTGKAGLWRPPDLQLALNWQKKQRPTRTWAQRYDIAFERAIVFLDTSRITYEAELKNLELLQQRSLRRARIMSLVLGIAAIIAIIFMIYGFTQYIEAEHQRVVAQDKEMKAIKAEEEAVRQREVADSQRQLAINSQKETLKALDRADSSLRIAQIARAEAEKNLKEAYRQEKLAIEAQGLEKVHRERAEEQTVIATQERDRANALLYLSIAQSMEAKSVTMNEPDLAGLLAMQGFLYHQQYGGRKYDPYVFNGLYYSVAKLSNDFNYNRAKVPGNLKNKMYALAVSKKSNAFYTTGNDGRIFKGDYINRTADNLVDFNPYPNKVLALSKNEKYLVNGSDSSTVQIFNLEQPGEKPTSVRGHRGSVIDIKFLPDDSGFISMGSDRTIRRTNQVNGESKLLATLPYEIKSIDISSDGKLLAAVAASGQLYILDLRTNTFDLKRDESLNGVRVLSVAFHPTRTILAYGTEFEVKDPVTGKSTWRGSVKLMDYVTLENLKEMRGHHAGVSDVEFSPDGLLLASAGYDKKLQMWVVDHEEDLPVVMDNNNGNIWSLAFTKDSDYLLASCNNGEVRVWPTDPKKLAEQICPKLKRNMTKEEWDIYVANGIDYESTCKSLLISDF
ncbi:MAG: hypothetical protein SH819_14415 [Cytophagales bacterium]|nr:hypothetical protein [Cytophagales bacterium]